MAEVRREEGEQNNREGATTFSRPRPAFASSRGHAGETDAFVAPSLSRRRLLSAAPLPSPLVPFSCRGRGTLFFFLPSLRGRHRQPTAFCDRGFDRAHGLGRFCVLAPAGGRRTTKKKRPNGNKARQKEMATMTATKEKEKRQGRD
ncbi:hypothetical protein pdul_cds_936 [Pandoravirus dulcis]|uniref:Uncharacterized protein n=1 Tax=Pandoravirus dulcis TaxID=1349409 RepID=S4VS15_9VIRU|nr:hypothetical protein pdul_cds_936 [Pandoravirus dulcis]AGO83183.1 hypothetical protein pdul_cds_936 [Pandoravirus dulcis]